MIVYVQDNIHVLNFVIVLFYTYAEKNNKNLINTGILLNLSVYFTLCRFTSSFCKLAIVSNIPKLNKIVKRLSIMFHFYLYTYLDKLCDRYS